MRTAAINIIVFLFLPVLGTGPDHRRRLEMGPPLLRLAVPALFGGRNDQPADAVATGKHSVWDKKQTPPWEPDGTPMPRDKRYWLPSSPPPSALPSRGRWLA
jgi:hypothetical protein